LRGGWTHCSASVRARDRLVRKRLLIDDEVDVLAVPGGEASEALVWEDEAEDAFEDVEELVLLLLLCVERVGETAERSRSLNAILRAGVFSLSSKELSRTQPRDNLSPL
jgi:hypothetical protein